MIQWNFNMKSLAQQIRELSNLIEAVAQAPAPVAPAPTAPAPVAPEANAPEEKRYELDPARIGAKIDFSTLTRLGLAQGEIVRMDWIQPGLIGKVVRIEPAGVTVILKTKNGPPIMLGPDAIEWLDSMQSKNDKPAPAATPQTPPAPKA